MNNKGGGNKRVYNRWPVIDNSMGYSNQPRINDNNPATSNIRYLNSTYPRVP